MYKTNFAILDSFRRLFHKRFFYKNLFFFLYPCNCIFVIQFITINISYHASTPFHDEDRTESPVAIVSIHTVAGITGREQSSRKRVVIFRLKSSRAAVDDGKKNRTNLVGGPRLSFFGIACHFCRAVNRDIRLFLDVQFFFPLTGNILK